jgi:hypothetical protein
LFGGTLTIGADYLYRADFQQRSKHVRSTTMLNDPSVNNAVNVNTRKRHGLTGWFDIKPNAFMRSSCCDARNHPFALGDLPLDRNMKIRVSLPDSENVRLGALNAYRMPLAIVDFGVLRGDQVFHQIDVSCVDDFFIETPNH